jgi:predicted dienelactone hydrolase
MRPVIALLTGLLLAAMPPGVVRAEEAAASDMAHAAKSFVDQSRTIKATMGFTGSPDRRIDVQVWHPPGQGGPWPLVVLSHGTFGRADNAMHIVRELVRHGYMVAAPDYPLSSSNAWTRIRFADISDVGNQVKDVSFIITSLLADAELGPRIDRDKIGIAGHSLGAVTSYFTAFGRQTRDPRVKAVAMTGGADPVQTAIENDMGLWGTGHSAVRLPVLFLTAEKDIFARTTGRHGAAFARLEGPKYEIVVKGGAHSWFGDRTDRPADNKNPDCLFFERNMPQMVMPGCEERVPLIGPEKQQRITRLAIVNFFDGWLKGDRAALKRLRGIARGSREVTLKIEE